jgi:hypothetical protein
MRAPRHGLVCALLWLFVGDVLRFGKVRLVRKRAARGAAARAGPSSVVLSPYGFIDSAARRQRLFARIAKHCDDGEATKEAAAAKYF